MPSPRQATIALSATGVVFAALIAGIVIGSLRRPQLVTYAPTPASPSEVLDTLTEPHRYTVDATSPERWLRFDFSRGSVVEVESLSDLDWDIAFQRHRMITNGGATNPQGQAGALDLGSRGPPTRLPASGYVADERRGDTPRNRVLENWYEYSWLSHILTPADRVFALRTADGKYAILRFLSYYCPGGRPGCVTFEFVYRGDGGRQFEGL